jgi:hypothetical protein
MSEHDFPGDLEPTVPDPGVPQRFDVEDYRADEGLPLRGALLMSGLMVAAALIFGFLASFIGQWIYLILMFPIFIGIGLGFAGTKAIMWGHVRNRWFAAACGLVGGVLAMGSQHYFEIINNGELDRAQEALVWPRDPKDTGQGTLQVHVYTCPYCDVESNAVVKLNHATVNAKGETTVKEVLRCTYPGEALPALENLCLPPPEPPSPPAQPT